MRNEYSITPEFWSRLKELRSLSRLVLAALEEDDVEEVERLSRDSERLMAEVRPIIEARVKSADRTEDDLLLKDLLGELSGMNDRILEELDERRREVGRMIGDMRDHKLKLTHYRQPSHPEAAILNVNR